MDVPKGAAMEPPMVLFIAPLEAFDFLKTKRIRLNPITGEGVRNNDFNAPATVGAKERPRNPQRR